ncbi:CDP-glycerol glycerophosphotransferase family protein [Caviibacter abscessus]|uniref:CDP-glycerol glycerophosphotransferase family protein n=1 Tax=Caviibacter abscessus TaxID=1766719 RepID=UPI0008334C7E|nr:CDP-glycerol glycerophosphotransferase family protein [Caviibacter abscessus]
MIRKIFNMILAFVTYPFCKIKEDIWLVGGNAGQLYVDNARAIHEFLLKRRKNVYWIVEKNSNLRNYFEKNNIPYLIKGSYKSYLYFMSSKVSLFSHSISADIVPYLCAVPFINYFHYKNYKVFLNHGTVGLKKRAAMNKKYEKLIDKLLKSYNLNPCDSKLEKDIKVNDWKMNEETMYVCGYPRYDRLYGKINVNSDILYMPTWRNYSDISGYINKINEFINNKKLLNYLKTNNRYLKVYIHQLMQDKIEILNNNDRIVLLDKNEDVTNLLKKSDILITDYSSVAYDFYFMRKKVIFYQFDQKEYLEKIGSYVDLNNLFGEVVFNADDVVESIISSKQIEYGKYFSYVDDKNCERLYKRILKDVYNGKG